MKITQENEITKTVCSPCQSKSTPFSRKADEVENRRQNEIRRLHRSGLSVDEIVKAIYGSDYDISFFSDPIVIRSEMAKYEKKANFVKQVIAEMDSLRDMEF